MRFALPNAPALTQASGSLRAQAQDADPRSGAASVWPDFVAFEPGRQVRVILIDDDPHIRRVVAGELSADMRINLVGQADCARSGKRLISNSEFDVMIVDLNLGDGTGFELIEHMKHVCNHAEAIVVSIMDDDERAIRAFELGATGYLVKSSWFGSFAQAVLQVCSGGASITPNLARRLLHRLGPGQGQGHGAAAERAPTRGPGLSERECEVLRQVSLGYTSREIATKLTLSVQTVNTHVRNIYRKLDVKTRAQAVGRAAQHRLI
jgi:DNA-binding NarL/FixJ family response regulator